MNSAVFRNISYGLYIISSLDGDRHTGCVANSLMQITSSPATMALSMNHDNFTNECIKNSGLFGVSILGENCDPGVIGKFGFQTGGDVNKFDGVMYTERNGLAVLNDSCGYITLKVTATLETSTHTVFLADVLDGDVLKPQRPMTYSYYHEVVKGKSPKNAPTYIEESPAAMPGKVYTCSVCGYVYDGEVPFEELPEDYVCPVCKAPKSKFVSN